MVIKIGSKLYLFQAHLSLGYFHNYPWWESRQVNFEELTFKSWATESNKTALNHLGLTLTLGRRFSSLFQTLDHFIPQATLHLPLTITDFILPNFWFIYLPSTYALDSTAIT